MKSSAKPDRQISEYLLSDYNFLTDYEIIQSQKSNNHSFTARIKDTDQKVRFTKKAYRRQEFNRFKALYKLFKNGIVLADNMFMVEECGQFYYCIIEAEMDINNPRFQSLQSYLYSRDISEEDKKAIIGKVKILLDCIHQQGQAYGGLDCRRIIIDDDQYVYIAPFNLVLELQNDQMSRAYYSPELLEIIHKEQSEITEEDMFKWDIWAFGCICLEIMLYTSPFFLTTSIDKQIKLIKNANLQNEVVKFQDSISNIIINSLNLQARKRTVSIHKIQQNHDIPPSFDINFRPNQNGNEDRTNSNPESKNGLSHKYDLRELNLHKNQEQGNSQLILNIFSLSNISFDKQLHVTIFLNRKYHFYIDFNEEESKNYKLSRKITIKDDFGEFVKLLSHPIIIQLREQNKSSRISINLQTLIIIYEGKRIWNKSLIGTYHSPEHSNFPKAKLKLSCVLNSPNIYQEQNMFKSILENVQNHSDKKRSLQNGSQQATKDLQSKEIVSKFKQEKYAHTPSISQIVKNITGLTEHWRKKNQEDKIVIEDDAKTKIQSMLQIEEG